MASYERGPKFTSMHYFHLAHIFREQCKQYPDDRAVIERVAVRMAKSFKHDNPGFNAREFFEAVRRA